MMSMPSDRRLVLTILATALRESARLATHPQSFGARR